MFDTLKEILVGKLKVADVHVIPEATAEDVELDSLAIVELSMVLEQEFGIAISEDELAEAATMGDIAHLMDERSTRIR